MKFKKKKLSRLLLKGFYEIVNRYKIPISNDVVLLINSLPHTLKQTLEHVVSAVLTVTRIETLFNFFFFLE